jgi:hypothetical protein
MDTNTALVPQNAISLDPAIVTKLETWEDHLSFYLQLEEGSTVFSWLKADTLVHLMERFGEQSLEKFANEVSQKRSTVINYVRTAKAFPPEKRIPTLSFSAHFQASYADSYDTQKGEFMSEKRFDWVEKAADEGFSTRKLAEEIKVEKKADAGEDPEVARRKVEAEGRVASLKNYLDTLYSRVEMGNPGSFDEIVKLYDTAFPRK